MYDFTLEGVPRDWRVAFIPKQNKPGEKRKITIPNDQLKEIQGGILNGILYKVPALKPSKFAFGFVPGRSTLDALMQHDPKADFFCWDIHNFFDNFPTSLTREQLLKGGLDEEDVDKIMEACSYQGTIPQGSPASPALTNIGFKEIDAMLSALAKKMNMTYTRYADDGAMSINWDAKGIPRKNIKVRVFKCVDKLLWETAHLHLKWSKCHYIPYRGRAKRQVLGITISDNGEGYNAPRKLRRKARAQCCNLYRKIKAQRGHVVQADWAAWAELKGTVQYLDTCRSRNENPTADPIIQEKFWNYLEGKFKCKN